LIHYNHYKMKLVSINIFVIFFALMANAQPLDLNHYLEQAKSNSPLINKTQNSNKLIRLDMQIVKNILSKPNVNVEANILFAPIISHDNNNNKFQWVSDGANSYTGYDLANSDGGQYQAIISVKQPLFLGEVYKSYSKQADIQSQLNDNNIVLTEHKLEQLVSHQYLLCLLAEKQRDISKSLLDKLNRQLKTMQKLVENAIYKQTDLMIMQIETKNYLIEYENYTAQYQNNLSDLNLLCGINDTNMVTLKDVNFELTNDPVNSSQFLKKYQLDSLNIQAKQTLFEQKYKPRLSLFANTGMNAIYTPSLNRFGFATGIDFSWNIFDGNQRKIQYDKSLIEMETLKFEEQNFINQYNINKNKYLSQILALDKQMSIVQSQLLEYKRLFNLYSIELSRAQVSIMDFKNLVRDISAKKQENLHLKMQKQALINLYNYWNF